MQCISCGKSIPITSKICPYCHRDTKASSEAQGAMTALAIVGGILGYLFNGWVGAFWGGIVIGGIGGAIVFLKAQSRFGSQAAKVEVVPDHESRRFSSTTPQELEQAVRAEKAGRVVEALPKPVSRMSPPSSVDHSIELLEKLVGLRANGTLTEEEFAAMKHEVLATKPAAGQMAIAAKVVNVVPMPSDLNKVKVILPLETPTVAASRTLNSEQIVRSSAETNGKKRVCLKCNHAAIVTDSPAAACPACGAIYTKVEQAIAAKAKAAASRNDTVPDLLLQGAPIVIAGEITKHKVKISRKDWTLAAIAVLVISGGIFAFGKVYRPTPTAAKTAVSLSSFLKAENPSDIKLGTLADNVLAVRGKALATKQVGDNGRGMLVEWEYPDITYLMGRLEVDGVDAYRVLNIVYGKDYKHPTYQKRNPTASQLQQEAACREMKGKNPSSDGEKCMTDAGYVFNEADFRTCVHVETDVSVCDKVAWIPRN